MPTASIEILEFLRRFLNQIEPITQCLSLVSTIHDAYEIITGATISARGGDLKKEVASVHKELASVHSDVQDLKRLFAGFRRVTDRVCYIPIQEVWDTTKSRQSRVSDRSLYEVGNSLTSLPGDNIIFSEPIKTPLVFREKMVANPQKLLEDIIPLGHQPIPRKYGNDPTTIPVHFHESGQPFLGLIKRAYARDYLNCEFIRFGVVDGETQTQRDFLNQSFLDVIERERKYRYYD